MKKTIITAAVTGSIHTPSLSPYLPVTPDEIANDAVAAYKAGAAIAHIHVRDPETGQPVSRNDLFREVATKVKKRCNMILCFTTGGGIGMTTKERAAVVYELKPELASFNLGSMCIGIFGLAEGIEKFKYSWEKEYLERTYDYTFLNTFKTLEEFAAIMKECGTKPELEAYDVSMINHAAWLIERGALKKPLHIQFVMGIFGGIPATVQNLVFLHDTAQRTIGDFTWSVCAAGKNQMRIGAVALAMGGNVRVGLEDSLWAGKGKPATKSADQVEMIARIAAELSMEIATPDEAREILGLKGLDKVNY